MKKKLKQEVLVSPPLKKILVIMRLVSILILVFTVHVSASVYSQQTKLSLNFEDVTIREVLNQIEKQSNYKFLLQNELLDIDKKVSVSANQRSIDFILDEIFSDQRVDYVVTDRNLIIIRPVSIDGQAQQAGQVTGQVTDSSGAPLPGVTVVVKNTTRGTVTDSNGNYLIKEVPAGATLVFSFVGMKRQEILVGNQSSINLAMVEDAIGIDEVVAVGYGTMKKNDLTGSISSVGSDEMQNLNITRAEQALVGKMPGVQVKQVSGEPGASPQILIRGINSIDKSTSPLFVVDGHPIGDINMINPNDIERMDILKDASATAIYGSRGTNGVVLITTKHGTKGKNIINLNAYAGVQTVSKTIDMMNSREIAQFQYDSFVNRNLDEGNDISGDPTTWRRAVPQLILDVLNGTHTVDTDWQDEVLQSSALVQSYHLSSAGGSEKSKYYISGEYYSQDGIIEHSGFERYSVRVSLDSEVNDWIKLGGTVNPTYTYRDDVQTSGGGENTSTDILSNALIAQPFVPVYNEEGEFTNMYGWDGAVNNTNPVAIPHLITDNEQATKILGNLYTEILFTKELTFKALLGYSILNFRNKFFRPEDNAFQQGVPYGSSSSHQTLNWLNTYTLNYTKTFNEKHNLNVLLGYDVQKDQYEDNFLESDNYPNNLVQTLNAASEIDAGSSFEQEWTLLSYLGRINYNYQEKYYLTTSLRRDGSSRFGSDKKWGWFPSAALAWRVTGEEFMQDLSSVSNLKLRISYGLTGNNNIGDYLYVPTVDYNNYILGNGLAAGYHPNRIANPLLHWEQQEEVNFGVDLGLFNNRLIFSSDYFVKKNKDLLLNVQIPAITGFSNTTTNIGTVRNKGWEFVVNSHNIRGQLNWTTNFNISFYRNEVLELGPEGDDIMAGAHITRIGEPVGMFYGWINEGVIMNQQELQEAPIYNPGGSSETRVGDLRFKDMNDDGVIDNDDRTIMGNPHPDFIYGMTNNFTYKGFDLEIGLQGIYGNDILHGMRSRITNTRGRRNQMAIMNDYWKSEENPGNGKIPRANNNPTGNNRGSYIDFWLEDGSFLRVSNISFGYNLPQDLVAKMHLQKLRVYVTAMNPFTFTKYNGYNPDVNDSTSPLTPGEDWNNYPLLRTVSFGINLSL